MLLRFCRIYENGRIPDIPSIRKREELDTLVSAHTKERNWTGVVSSAVTEGGYEFDLSFILFLFRSNPNRYQILDVKELA